MSFMNIPGWIDLQVNGFKGINFSSPNLTLEDINHVNIELHKRGTVGYCPTLISSPTETYKHNLPLLSKAMSLEAGAKILGIHLEGPFLNPTNGPRGIHSENCIRNPSIKFFEKLYNLANENIALVTVAPEQPKALDLIEYISNSTHSTVSLGHTLADSKIIRDATNLGARAATHVGNGISEQINRHKNPIWTILAEDDLYGLFITDGFHLPKEFIKVALRAKKVSKFIVTSDLIHFSGMSPGNYKLNGVKVVLEPNGYFHRKNSNQLAGSTRTMMNCVNFIFSLDELAPNDIQKIAFENPLMLLKKPFRNYMFNSIKIKFKNGSFIL
ncbi:MAG: N-acetylglucosamine-6-phosphate deacetylase [Promethearchaeota archaeon]|nr:MAG: N-acetylglucosamine-6-phosphate deacetylase [Candidatus Lokiarchaeota archaeon]